MTGYKPAGFQERLGSAAQAKQKAIDQLKAKPAPDPEAVARRAAERAERDRAKEAARLEKAQEAERAAAGATQAAEAEVAAAAERKAARDARYAARKGRR